MLLGSHFPTAATIIVRQGYVRKFDDDGGQSAPPVHSCQGLSKPRPEHIPRISRNLTGIRSGWYPGLELIHGQEHRLSILAGAGHRCDRHLVRRTVRGPQRDLRPCSATARIIRQDAGRALHLVDECAVAQRLAQGPSESQQVSDWPMDQRGRNRPNDVSKSLLASNQIEQFHTENQHETLLEMDISSGSV
jgi:hypothetical protein